MKDIENKIEAFLLFRGGAVSKKLICSTLSITQAELEESIHSITKKLEDTGLTLIDNGIDIALSTSKTTEEFISKLRDSEYMLDLSRPAKEILSLIIYAGPISKQDIDFLRGVNSQYVLKKLILRGLIQDEKNTTIQRVREYSITIDLMTHLGINKIEDLPDYAEFRETILSSIETIRSKIKLD